MHGPVRRGALALLILLLPAALAFGRDDVRAPAGDSRLPDPPTGYRWQPVAALTDEFAGDHLNAAKWQPRQPYWAGREPSRFAPENVYVHDGQLRLRSTTRLRDLTGVADPSRDVWVQAACVASHEPIARYGYYEARLRASDLCMTSSFWFQGKYSEIDVIEQIGHSLKNPEKDRQMLSNTHYFRSGWDHDVSTPRRTEMATGSAAAYHTYGVWWKDADTVIFYLDGKPVQQVRTGGAFREPMYLFFDTEVFTWEGLPTVESLRDPRRNIMSVDWVRAWRLVPSEHRTEQRTTARPR